MIAYTLTEVLPSGTLILSAIFVVPLASAAQPTNLWVESTS